MAVTDLIVALGQVGPTTLSLYLGGALLLTLLAREFVVWYRLRHIPGPWLNSVTILPLLYRNLKGDIHDYMKDLSDQYGG